MRLWQYDKKKVRKTLTFHHALLSDIRERYEKSKGEKEKKKIKRLFAGKLVRKYKLQEYVYKEIGFRKSKKEKAPDGEEKRTSRRAAEELRNQIKEFYLRDDNSRLTTGKKSTITQQKVKKQASPM